MLLYTSLLITFFLLLYVGLTLRKLNKELDKNDQMFLEVTRLCANLSEQNQDLQEKLEHYKMLAVMWEEATPEHRDYMLHSARAKMHKAAVRLVESSKDKENV